MVVLVVLGERQLVIGNEKYLPMLVAFVNKPPASQTYIERLNLTVTYQFTSVSEWRKLISE